MQCVKAKVVYTGKGKAEKTHLVFNRGKVVGLSRRRRGKLLGEFPVVTPAMVDPHCHIGMHRSGEPSAEG
ncbi:MAG: imidazolonepropionase, partial [Planctomycetota bacterium]